MALRSRRSLDWLTRHSRNGGRCPRSAHKAHPDGSGSGSHGKPTRPTLAPGGRASQKTKKTGNAERVRGFASRAPVSPGGRRARNGARLERKPRFRPRRRVIHHLCFLVPAGPFSSALTGAAPVRGEPEGAAISSAPPAGLTGYGPARLRRGQAGTADAANGECRCPRQPPRSTSLTAIRPPPP